MKKVVLAVIAVLGFALTGFAQEGAKKAVKKTETTVKEVKKEVKATDAKAKEAKVVLKKDGTPDKRYKEAKEVVLKKDGTPDKRYKQK